MERNNKYLKKGINFLSFTLPMLVVSPIVINMGFKGQAKLSTNIILYVGVFLAVLTLFLFVFGIRYLLKYLFSDV